MRKSTLRKRTSTRILAAAAIVSLLLAGCGPEGADPVGDVQPDEQGTDDLPDGESAYNDVDVEFMQGMIPHHMQAVRMAEMVPGRTASGELEQLAEDIIASQTEEISLMSELLEDAGVAGPPVSDDDMFIDGGGHMGGMDDEGPMGGGRIGGMGQGMISPDEMRELMASEGREFDLMWTDAMIRHHEGAIVSAEQVVEQGRNPRVRELAEDIIAEQEAEIEQMRQWRQEWRQS